MKGTSRTHPALRRCALGLALAWVATMTAGCAVVAVVDTAASVAIGVGGLAVDAAVGTVRIGGKVVGAGADLVLGSDSEE
jgi:hypothetical protein